MLRTTASGLRLIQLLAASLTSLILLSAAFGAGPVRADGTGGSGGPLTHTAIGMLVG
jgi:hypothetical protein